MGLLFSQHSFGLLNVGCVKLATFHVTLRPGILEFNPDLYSLDKQTELRSMHDNAVVMWSARSARSHCQLGSQVLLFMFSFFIFNLQSHIVDSRFP